MSNPFNGSNRGMRGGASDRPSRKTAFQRELQKETHGTCHTKAVIMEQAKFLEVAEVGEVIEEIELRGLARRSLTSQQFLRLRKREAVETVDLKLTQPDRMNPNLESVKVAIPSGMDQFGNPIFKTGTFTVHKMTTVTNPKTLAYNETSLLTQGNPCSDIEDANIKRMTSRTKVIRRDRYDGMLSGAAIKQTVNHTGKEVKD